MIVVGWGLLFGCGDIGGAAVVWQDDSVSVAVVVFERNI